MCLITRGAHPCLVSALTLHITNLCPHSQLTLYWVGGAGEHILRKAGKWLATPLSLSTTFSLFFLLLSLICHKTLEQGSPARCAALWWNSKKKAKEQKSQRKHEKNEECNKHRRKLSPILHSLVHHIDFAANHCIPEDLSDSDLWNLIISENSNYWYICCKSAWPL